MRTHALAILLGSAVVVGTYAATSKVPDDPAPTKAVTAQPLAAQPLAPSTPAEPQYGHLIVQLEGNIHGLNVTWITPKTSGYNKTKLESGFEIDLFDGAGAKLGTYPIDLSRFDTSPARVGKPLHVEGCEVHDSRIVTMVNVPYFKTTATMRIRNRGIVIGRLDARQLAALTAQGEVR